MEQEQLEIRDHRNKQWFWVDDEYLNGYARLLRPNSTLVYLALCRHANKDQQSWPSYDLLMEKLGLARATISNAIKELEEWGIIKVERSRNEQTKRQNPNIYILLDKRSWKPKPSSNSEPGAEFNSAQEPSSIDEQKPSSNSELEVNTVLTKHIEPNILAKPVDEVNELLDFFKQNINPHINFANKTERKACNDLLNTYGLERVKQSLLFLEHKRKTDKYLPTVASPYDLWTKWAKIKQRLQTKQPRKIWTRNSQPTQ